MMHINKFIELNHVEASSELYREKLVSKEVVLLNTLSRSSLQKYIMSMLNLKQEVLVSFIAGPVFLGGVKSTLSKEGWFTLLKSSGFVIIQKESKKLNNLFSDIVEPDIEKYWQQYNPYKDGSTINEIYLTICSIKKDALVKGEEHNKVANFPVNTPGKILYLVHFFQDLVFLRGLLARFKCSDIVIIVNEGNIAFHHLTIINKFILNYELLSYTMNSFSIEKLNKICLFMTATLGVETPMHLSCSKLVENIRNCGIATVTLQHGITLPINYTTITEYVFAWNESAAHKIHNSSHNILTPKVINSGYIRPRLNADNNFFHYILGEWGRNFNKYIMIGTNLHWDKVHKVDGNSVYEFIYKQCNLNPNILFIIRPHPEDYNLNDLIFPSNTLILNDIITGLLDLSIDEFLVNCHGLISTYSTLLYDAARQGLPIASFERDLSLVDDRGMYPELNGMDIIKNNISFNILDWLSKDRPITRFEEDIFNRVTLDLINKVGLSMKEEEKNYIKKLNQQYKITAPDYGRKAYKNALESGFLRGISDE